MALAVQEYVAEQGLVARVAGNEGLLRLLLERSCRAILSNTEIYGLGHLWGVHVEVPCGRGAEIVDRLKRSAYSVGIEFMGGWKQREGCDSVHMTLTPAFDLSETELNDLVTAAITFLAGCLANVRDVTKWGME